MPRIRCLYIDCVFLEDGYCSKGAVELDPDEGCLTYRAGGALVEGDDPWEDNDDDLDDWEDDFDEEDIWLDDDDDF
jgi:hypothetical protein